ncbi:MAG: TIGR03905 family TSCPD domain-containing protein [Clostridia bacterium]
MHYTYKPVGVCSSKIDFDIEDGIVRNVVYEQGCQGNLKAIGILLEGMPAAEVVKKLKGVRCGAAVTSCSDQLAIAIEKAIAK